MPNKGFVQSVRHRAKIRQSNLARAARVREALAVYTPPPRKKFKGKTWDKPPVPTPVPPSAGSVSSPTRQRWGIYSHHTEGAYYFKREHADSLDALQKLTKQLQLPLPLWTYCKSGHTDADVVLPIRIPENHVRTYGLRWQPFTFRKRKG